MSLKLEVTKVHRDEMYGYGTIELEIMSDDLKPRQLITIDVEEINPLIGRDKPYILVRIVPHNDAATLMKVQL